MWQKIRQRLADPVFYRKHGRRVKRLWIRPRAPMPVRLEAILEPGRGPVVAVCAHPDDEFFASGLLCEAVERRIETEIVCLTRGEGGPVGDGTRAELGERRERELRSAAAALGIGKVTFLGHVDPVGLSHRSFAPPVTKAELAEQIRRHFEKRPPSLVVTHGSGGEYWHPAHLLIHGAVFEALGALSQSPPPAATFHAWQPEHPHPALLNRDDPADLVLDTRRFRSTRLAALEAHQSQAQFFRQLSRGNSLESFVVETEREAYRIYANDESIRPPRVTVAPEAPAVHASRETP